MQHIISVSRIGGWGLMRRQTFREDQCSDKLWFPRFYASRQTFQCQSQHWVRTGHWCPWLVTANCFDWNTFSLHACRKVQELTHELKCYWWDILCLAEVRWTGFRETTTDAGHMIWYHGEDSKHQYEVTFIVWKAVVGSIISCTPISNRLISIRISARPYNVTVIQVCRNQPYTMKTRR